MSLGSSSGSDVWYSLVFSLLFLTTGSAKASLTCLTRFGHTQPTSCKAARQLKDVRTGSFPGLSVPLRICPSNLRVLSVSIRDLSSSKLIVSSFVMLLSSASAPSQMALRLTKVYRACSKFSMHVLAEFWFSPEVLGV